jgi:hypothetical protein
VELGKYVNGALFSVVKKWRLVYNRAKGKKEGHLLNGKKRHIVKKYEVADTSGDFYHNPGDSDLWHLDSALCSVKGADEH